MTIRLLGPMEMTVGGKPVAVPGAAERALLVQLLLSPGRTIPATMLVERLWAESALPVDPMNALQIRVSKLRRSLKAHGVEDLVSREGVGYRAAVDPSAVDAVDFATRIREARAGAATAGDAYDINHLQAYDNAVSLWRGEPLSEFSGDQWATIEASRLTELRLAALTERAHIALALGRHHEVVGDLEPLVAADPTLESMAGMLMIALYRSGRQADALEVYTRSRIVLDESLGLEPSASLRSLHERVLRQDESLGSQPELTAPAPVMTRGGKGRTDEQQRAATTNLPTVLRPLIGRDDQLDSLDELIAGARLLTLIGPGGAGKTSLAIATAVRVGESFTDGAIAVRLGSVDSPSQVPLAVADALGVPLDGAAADRDVRERIVAYLSRRRMLLLVDNCEHVVDAAASLIDAILGRCPGVTILATSREALAVPDETQVAVGPLETPPEGTEANRVLDYPAAQLFVQRAHAMRPGNPLSEEDLEAVAKISRALDGMPLALELAAARTAAMSLTEISDRLAQRFTFLTSGARTAEARQQTLKATVEWSYALLSELDQKVFNRLSVFQGGWTLTAAEAVVSDPTMAPGKVLDTIGRLVERSMVVVEPGPTTRYRMLETLRHYAAEQLAATDERPMFVQRHADFFRGFAQSSEMELRGHGQREALQRLRDEQPNLRAALTWLGTHPGTLDSALTMAGSLGLFWHLGRHLEGREVLARLLNHDGSSPAARARALQAVSIVERPRACLVHPSPRCAETARESLAIFEDLGDQSRAALSRVLLAVEGMTGAHPEEAEALLHEAHEQFLRDGDPWGEAVIGFVRMETALKGGDQETAVTVGRATAAAFRQLDDPWGLSATLYHLGSGLRQFGRYEEGARVLEEAIDVATSAGLYNTVQWALADLGEAQLHLDNLVLARETFDRAAAASEYIGDGAGAVLASYGYALLARRRGDWVEARTRFTAAFEGFQALGTPLPAGLALAGLARCDEAQEEVVLAGERFSQVLETGRSTGELELIATALEGLARLSRTSAHADEAERQLDEARAVRERSNRPA